MYRVADKVIHTFEDGDKVEIHRLESLDNTGDKWGVDIYYSGVKRFAHRYDSKQEALAKFEGLINE